MRDGSCKISNSAWLASGVNFDEGVLTNLTKYDYAEQFVGKMGSEAYDTKLQNWLNVKTGGRLTGDVANQKMDEQTLACFLSASYFNDRWPMHLREKEHKTFHGTNGDKQVTMLEKSINCGEYYKGNHYKAVEVSLMHGTSFWLFLPDKGYTLSNVFKDNTYVDIMRGKAKPARKGGDITIRFPQMDESTSLDAQRALRKLGVAKAFSLEGQYEILADERVKMAGITGIVHATRIMVDKEGITAASFANAMLAGAAQTKWEMNFNCNRPFAYAVADEKGLVYYLGTVQEAPKAPEAKNPPRSIMVDGQVYQEYEMERYMDDNRVDGTITDSVSSDKLPTKDNQSNFGTGYTYQKHDDWCVDVCVDGRWISFIVGEE